jgi:hypothetical protein
MSSRTIQPDDVQARVALVRKAISLAHVGGCFEWLDDKVQIRVGNDPANHGLTPTEIRVLARGWVIDQGGVIREKRERRTEWMDRREYFYYVVPVAGFLRGLFVEMELEDPDPDCPVVFLVNSHEEREGPIL